MTSPALHVVFGAGQVGPPLALLLADRGHRVRVVSRSGRGPDDPRVERLAADALDRAAVARAAEGAAVVYHCMNPAYSARVWADELPRMQEHLVAAAGRAGARLVVLDNLYAAGRTGGRPIDEETPDRPCSRKGEVRARVGEALLAAHRRGDVRAVGGRASDFYGPGGVGTHFGERFWKGVLRGEPAQVLVRPDTPHSYHFIPDVAAALAALGEAPESALGRRWILPAEPAGSTADLARRLGAAAGRPVRLARVPGAIRFGLGLFMPVVRELGDELWQWEEPWVVDDRRFRQAFPAVATTPLDEGARATVAWARAAFGGGGAPAPGGSR